ncbi:NADP-dependent oxidoreductase [Rhizobium sp. 2MFCol3.1]|uniref:NADP-dependent oxidoreductase n=1 Tax=Rhizobium sp. 2MFCol3.1 TaxID=1246459 RepID=UPI0003799FEB|nr:NADP-dependent oxidoreductase [Rhizobium sp. 2MFCol3.1]
MKSMILSAYDRMPQSQEIAAPVPDEGEVLVRVVAASLNPLDVKLQSGLAHDYFPLNFPSAMGTDLSGIIEKTGSLTSRWRAGDKVIARLNPTRGGAFADFAIVPENQLVLIPETLALETAAGIPTAAGTAWQALVEYAGIVSGQTVLIHAGAGGVGSFAIQFARGLGARVIATASGDGIDIARKLGADFVIDYRHEDFADKIADIDFVLDTIGSETQQESYKVLRRGGKIASIVAPPDETMAKAYSVDAGFIFHSSNRARLTDAVKAIQSFDVEILVDSVLPFSQFDRAFERQASGRARGKIILTI